MMNEWLIMSSLIWLSAMYHKIRQVHGLNVTRDQVYSAMADVDPDGFENRKPILKKKKSKGTFSWLGSFNGRTRQTDEISKQHIPISGV